MKDTVWRKKKRWIKKKTWRESDLKGAERRFEIEKKKQRENKCSEEVTEWLL